MGPFPKSISIPFLLSQAPPMILTADLQPDSGKMLTQPRKYRAHRRHPVPFAPPTPKKPRFSSHRISGLILRLRAVSSPAVGSASRRSAWLFCRLSMTYFCIWLWLCLSSEKPPIYLLLCLVI